jgi:ribosomal-protein-alanine N-acetyltransferase
MIGVTAVRRATQADEWAIDGLMQDAKRVALRVPWDQVMAALAQRDLFLVEQEGQMACVCGLCVKPEAVAQVCIFALRDAWPVHKAVQRLLPPIVEALHQKRVTSLAFIGSEEWLLHGLMDNGFRQVNTILTLQKTDFAVPDPGNSLITVRPADRDDLTDVLDIDRAALEPLWHNTMETLAQCLDAACFDVAELNGRIVGYAYATLRGRHGHLARIAVHPDWQGQRIGVRLLATVVSFFRQRRAFGMTLNTQQDNVRARRLYEWFGFKFLGEEAQVLIRDV